MTFKFEDAEEQLQREKEKRQLRTVKDRRLMSELRVQIRMLVRQFEASRSNYILIFFGVFVTLSGEAAEEEELCV